MKRILILLSFLMAINLVFCTYYGGMLKNVKDLVENNMLQEILETHTEKKSEFLVTSFWFLSPVIELEEISYNSNISENFSTFEQDILLPPPDFSRFSS